MPLQGHRPILLRQTPVKILHHILTRSHPLTQKMPGQDKDASLSVSNSFSTFCTPGAGEYGFSFVFSLMISLFFGCSPGVYGVTSLTFFSQFFILLTHILSLIVQILTWIFLSSVERHNMQAAHSPDMQRLLP